jgi:hypothetical protein
VRQRTVLRWVGDLRSAAGLPGRARSVRRGELRRGGGHLSGDQRRAADGDGYGARRWNAGDGSADDCLREPRMSVERAPRDAWQGAHPEPDIPPVEYHTPIESRTSTAVHTAPSISLRRSFR